MASTLPGTDGKLVFHIMGARTVIERDLIREGTKAGMKAAKKHSKYVERPISLSNGLVRHMKDLLYAGKIQIEIAELSVGSPNSIGREAKKNNV